MYNLYYGYLFSLEDLVSIFDVEELYYNTEVDEFDIIERMNVILDQNSFDLIQIIGKPCCLFDVDELILGIYFGNTDYSSQIIYGSINSYLESQMNHYNTIKEKYEKIKQESNQEFERLKYIFPNIHNFIGQTEDDTIDEILIKFPNECDQC